MFAPVPARRVSTIGLLPLTVTVSLTTPHPQRDGPFEGGVHQHSKPLLLVRLNPSMLALSE